MVGCSDSANVIKYDTLKKVQKPFKCMHLVVFPPDIQIERVSKKMYHFTQDCNYRLIISKKSGIVCNSNQNAPKKVLNNFPSGFVRLDLYDGDTPLYSYYKDLTKEVSDEDIKSGMERLKKDIF
jgi:hypothetical protein